MRFKTGSNSPDLRCDAFQPLGQPPPLPATTDEHTASYKNDTYGPPVNTAEPSRDAHILQPGSQSPAPQAKSPAAEIHAEIDQAVFEALESAPRYLPRRSASEARPAQDSEVPPIVVSYIPDQDLQATPRMPISGEVPTVRSLPPPPQSPASEICDDGDASGRSVAGSQSTQKSCRGRPKLLAKPVADAQQIALPWKKVKHGPKAAKPRK